MSHLGRFTRSHRHRPHLINKDSSSNTRLLSCFVSSLCNSCLQRLRVPPLTRGIQQYFCSGRHSKTRVICVSLKQHADDHRQICVFQKFQTWRLPQASCDGSRISEKFMQGLEVDVCGAVTTRRPNTIWFLADVSSRHSFLTHPNKAWRRIIRWWTE